MTPARLLLVATGLLVLAGTGRAADPVPARVIPVVVTAEVTYTWTLKDPPKIEESLTTSSLLTRAPIGAKGDVVYQHVEFFLVTQGHHFPLRWTADAGGLWLVNFFVDQATSECVPGQCIANRVPARFVVGIGPTPKLDREQDEGFAFDGGELIISSSGDRPAATSLLRGFLAAYERDPKPDELVRIAAVGKPPKGGAPPFTFDFAPPSGPDQDWTLYVQRAPRKTIEVVTFRADKEGKKVRAKVESIPVPFAEPFFAHRDSTGQVFFITEVTGRVFVAEPPTSDRKEWKVTTAWNDAVNPVVAVVRDSRDGSAYACIPKTGKTSQGEDRVLLLSGKPVAKMIDLKKVASPNVNRTELTAAWFGRAIGSNPPMVRPK